jgi:hypothetical protein
VHHGKHPAPLSLLPHVKTSSFIRFFFFGNYFYGLCAVALCIEASLQQQYPLNHPLFYLGVFAATTWFYTKAYITEKTTPTANPRTNWYIENKSFVWWSQLFFLLVCIALFIVFWFTYYDSFHIDGYQLFLLLIFPLVASLYYGISIGLVMNFSLRSIGWLKPFVIGFAWAGVVTVYPVLYHNITNGLPQQLTLIGFLLFLKNFMFVTVLCIMFDIKDYAMDHNQRLKTFVVAFGLRKTIFFILMPLCIAGLGTFLVYGTTHGFSAMKIILNTIPFICLLIAAYSLHRKKSILYYLILIDGLMLLKGLCGSIAMYYF